jgi:flagellar hook-basal body complex protein FliE
MTTDPLAPLAPLPPLQPLDRSAPAGPAPAGGGGFATVLNGLLANNAQANASMNGAITALATGEAQDLHTVAVAVAQADLSFRLILELRNRISDALQEVTRMQV